MSDLIQVLLRPVPERRPSAEQLLTCSKLDQEVKAYLSYVTKLREPSCGDGARPVKKLRLRAVAVLLGSSVVTKFRQFSLF